MLKRLIYKLFGLEYLHKQVELLVTKSREHDQDLIRVMDEQLQLRQQYPLHDIKVVPTDNQIGEINEKSNISSKRKRKSKNDKGNKRTSSR